MVGTRALYRHMTFVRVMDVPRGARPYHPLGQRHLPQTEKSPSHSATPELLQLLTSSLRHLFALMDAPRRIARERVPTNASRGNAATPLLHPRVLPECWLE